ncbi:hypothetical protein [Aeromicrobium sp.]|uniref:hypothetical protein n=1 Tax=Aeromicrobium sp. TaxID=1871063 RepID=UPI002FC9947E
MATRRERVILELEDHLSTGMAKAAAATALLGRSLDDLDGSATDVEKSLPRVSRETDTLGRSSRRVGSDINQLTGRMALLARVGATVGPALAPIAAVGAAGVAGLASQLGFASIGALSLIVATRGVGDALKAVNDAALEPTAKNLDKAEAAMAKLAPQAQAFVERFQELRPVLADLRKSASAGWFPGLTQALDSLEDAAPRLESILFAVSAAGGNAIASGAESLAGKRWAEFFQFVEDEAPDAIAALSRSVGSLAHGFAELWMAFDPVNDGVRDWLVDVADSFDMWATGLDQTEGFAEFLAYVNESGPKVADAAGAIANAVLQIGEAAAPLGGPVLEGLTAIADIIAAIADSPLGTPIMTAVTALSAASLATRAWSASLGVLGTKSQLAGIGIVGLVASANAFQTAFEKVADLRVDSSSLTRDLEALADGRITKNFDNLFHTFQDIDNLGLAKANPIGWVTDWDPTGAEAAEKNIKAIDEALAGLVESGDSETAARAFKELEAAGKDAGKSTKELAELFPEYATAIDNTVEPTEKAGWAINTFSQKVERGKIAMQEARTAARESGKAFISFSDDIAGSEFTLSGWLKAFEAQVKALANFRDNIQTLRNKGLKGSIIDELIKQGPAAAQAVEGLAKDGGAAIERLNKAARGGRREIRGMGEDAAAAKGELLGLGKAESRPLIDLRAESFNAKMRGISADLRAADKKKATPKADLNKKPFDTTLGKLKTSLVGTSKLGTTPRASLLGVPAIEQQLANITRPRTVTISASIKNLFADGGLVRGPGGPRDDAIPAMLSNKEYVVNADAVEHYGVGFFDAANAKRLASGGPADDRQSFRVRDERMYDVRPATYARAASSSTVTYATDPATTRELRELRAEVRRGTAVNAAEHKDDRLSMRAGNSIAARRRPRGYVPS